MRISRHQGDARPVGTLGSFDRERFANFETAGCSKCRFKGCRACRGYTMREYKAFLEAQEQGGRQDAVGIDDRAGGKRGVDGVDGGVGEVGEDGVREEVVVGRVPVNGTGRAGQGCSRVAVVRNDCDSKEGEEEDIEKEKEEEEEKGKKAMRIKVKKKVGCSKCRFRGCKKCRGYTLAELRANEALRGEVLPVTSIALVTPPRVGEKRGREMLPPEGTSLGVEHAGSLEEAEGAYRGASSKKTRWAMGTLFDLKAKVMSVVAAPLQALSSLPFWSRGSSDDEDGVEQSRELEEGDQGVDEVDGEEDMMDAVVDTEPVVEELVVNGDVEGKKSGKMRARTRASIPKVVARRSRMQKPHKAVSTEQGRLGTFPHLLARPNRVAPPRAKLRQHLRQQLREQLREELREQLSQGQGHETADERLRVIAGQDGGPCVHGRNELPVKSTPETMRGKGATLTKKKTDKTDKQTKAKTSRRGTRTRELTTVEVTPPVPARQSRTSADKAEGAISQPVVCVETPGTVSKTPLTRNVTVLTGSEGDVKANKTRRTRLSAAKAATKRKVTKTTPKGADKPVDPTSIVETPAAHDDPYGKEDGAVAERIPIAEKLFDELVAGLDENGEDQQTDAVAAGVDIGLDMLADEDQNVQDEQHSTPTPEVSFSFADMAGASKDTVSAELFHKGSQDEQGSYLTSASGLSPLRLPEAVDSDFDFAEALQAFSSPDHDHQAVMRAMDVVGNLMSDLDVSPDGKNGRQLKALGKYGRRLPGLSPTFDVVDPNSGSPSLSPVSFVLPDASGRSKDGRNNQYGSALDGRVGKKKASKQPKGKRSLNQPISSWAADQGSLESAKHLLKKKMVLKQASQNALYMKVREVIINRHLVEIRRQGHDWANLDACGVPLDTNIDHIGIEAKVLGSVRKEYGDETLQRLVTKVEDEWKRMCAVRQMYSKDAAVPATGALHGAIGGGNAKSRANVSVKTTPTRSILRQQRSSERLKGAHTLRWAPETVQHTYMPNAAQQVDDREKEPARPPSSTRGLRMLGLASASPKGGNGSGGKVPLSPMPPSPTGLTVTTNNTTATTTTTTTTTPGGSGGNGTGGSGGNGNGPTRRRSRTQNIQNIGTRSSQGQRLFQALQNASYPDSHQPSSTPRTLAMIFDSLPDNEHDHSNNNSSGGPTTSDTTTSSNSSRGSGGGGRWEQAEVECLIRGFREWLRLDGNQYVWKFIGDKYRGNGLSDCRTNDDLKSKWKAMRKTVGKNRRLRYVVLKEDDLEFLRSEASKP